ncbi:Eukaryotic translation initiation factor 4 gamma 3 [Chionoecetes opilio]|uniref:Eukaryotic translation initiation factor 4 gamma 3 n=1 Tax=Chionoecetes opilio TaxID=41210 RepID=A0A8J4Y966_CHIOP|nr:Eukaryotic translation initiation factor 4 gamma 3 [Chionoecetes opilio]
MMKVMRSILNKLTPEKFNKLMDTVKTMPINTTERLSAVIDLIFEKAVDEQGFSSTYAQMCQVLSLMSVKGSGSEANTSKQSEVKFRNLIINKCQKEFEKDNTEDFRAEKTKEIDACSDPDEKKLLTHKLDYEETKMRKRSVGNIRFIGELYKLRMLTSPIMMRIIGTLLERGDEESLECLCKLLSTIGKILETQCAQQPKAMSELEKYLKVMDKLAHGKSNIVTRVKFLMMDVIDLRQNNWVPRREDSKPKTKAQVQETRLMLIIFLQEVKREEFEQQIALASNPGRRDDRDNRDRDRRRIRDNRGPQMSEEGWSTVASTKGRASFDSSRLKTFARPGATADITLRSNFGDWGRGSSGGGLKDHNENKQQESNRFNVLVDSMGGNSLAGDNRRNMPNMGGNRLAPGGPARQGFGSKSMPPPLNDKESAISAVKKFVAPDRSKSTSRPVSRDNSISREPEPMRGYAQVDIDALGKISVAIVDEFTHNCDPAEAKLCLKEKFVPNTMKFFVQFSLEWVLDRDSKKRKLVGQLFHDLLHEELLTAEQLLEGSQDILGMVEDFMIDIPQSPNKVSDMFNASGLSWSSLLPPSANVEEFLVKYQVEFTVDQNKTGNHSGWNPQKVEAEFLKLFKRASNDEIFGWIEANIGNDAKSSKFIRALVTALVESQAATSNDGSSIRVSEDFEEKMKNRLAVVLKYVDGSELLEMQVIYALQALCVKHQYPQGLLEKCFNAFYDSEVVSEEAFEEWVKSKDPEEQEGKGVCETSVQSFMRWLKEADEEG